MTARAAPGAPKRSRSKSGPKPDFHRQTVLFQWALSQLGLDASSAAGSDGLKEFRDRFRIGPDSADGIDPRTGFHRFFEWIAGVLPTMATGGRLTIAPNELQEYEQNILAHTQSINTARLRHGQPQIQWKYHQYIALLFTEIYLDRYFADAAALRDEINTQIGHHNQSASAVDQVEPFSTAPSDDPRNQLSMLAFWCATGSGKTLLMHVHVLQFRHYHARAFAAGRWPKLDQVILVTPNDGLSLQHAAEFTHSGLDAVSVGEQGVDGLFSGHAQRSIKILSIHKFKEDQGKATVATEAFEGCNLVLVDEGHRGAGSGEEGAWFKRREQIARGGFTFEYSATFKEAIGTDEDMKSRYARSVLFDYAYRSFYRDGYGKDFTILNLESDDHRKRYLTAALLLFHQQMRVWQDGGPAMRVFQVDKPLWVFVGHTVSGPKAESAVDKGSVSDVVDVLLFIRDFLASPAESTALLLDLLENGFTDSRGKDLLAHRLPHLDGSGDKRALAQQLHSSILRDIFNAPGGGALAVQLIRGAIGELALKVGESEPFGVVNVGDPVAVAEACVEQGIVKLEDDHHRASLFHAIHRDDSPVNLLVGARKFTEGWNSWRVSSIGLMRMGRNEGTQIIQLFGRGVRLRGYGMSLRRSSVLAVRPDPPRNLRQVETLQVFGVKAAYMEQFSKWIHDEIPEAVEKQVWELPTVVTLPTEPTLKTIQLREMIEGVGVERGHAFRLLGPLVILRPPDDRPEDVGLREGRTRLNWLPRIRGIVGADKKVTTATSDVDAVLPEQSLKAVPHSLFDVDSLLFGLEAHKASHGLDRLHVDRAAVRALLACDHWYELFAAPADLRLDSRESIARVNRMAQQLLNSYAERFYRSIKGRWEAPYLEVVDVTTDDTNIVHQYTIETTEHLTDPEDAILIAGFVADITKQIQSGTFSRWTQWAGHWRAVPFAGHLYQPLFHLARNQQIRISPVALNESEAKFVDDLAAWCTHHPQREVFLLRNRAVTGLGFFQAANYFPDFLLWVQDGAQQHLAFVDPKGLHHFDRGDAKIQFATREIPRLQAIVSRQNPHMRLHAFVISNTPFANLGWTDDTGTIVSKSAIEQLGVLFQVDDATTYVDSLMRCVLSSSGGP